MRAQHVHAPKEQQETMISVPEPVPRGYTKAMEATEYVFVFADLAGYTALTEAHGDEGGATVATRFHELTRAALSGAKLVKTLGDGVMIVAPEISTAVRVAEKLAKQVAEQSDFPAVRIGLHQGCAVVRASDYFGNSVNLTARVMEAAKPGQILCTECVADAVMAHGLARAVPVGIVHLKHVLAPVALYELAFEGPIGPFKHLDPVCRMLVDASTTQATLEHEGTDLYFCSDACAQRFARAPESYLSVVTISRLPAPPS